MINERIKKLRKKNKITQKQLSIILGVSQSAIASWEKGMRRPSTNYISKLSKLFGVSIDYLINGETEESYSSIDGLNGLFRKTVSKNNLSKEKEKMLEEDLSEYLQMRAESLKKRKK